MCSNELWAVSWCPGIRGIMSCSLGMQSCYIFIPPLHWRWNEGILDSPRCLSIHLSVRPSVCRQGFGNFLKKLLAQFISYLAFILRGESLDPYSFSCSWPHFWASGSQLYGRKWGFWNFLKKLLAPFISYLAFPHIGWVSWPLHIFVFLASFSAL